jgi:hypothetical protein
MTRAGNEMQDAGYRMQDARRSSILPATAGEHHASCILHQPSCPPRRVNIVHLASCIAFLALAAPALALEVQIADEKTVAESAELARPRAAFGGDVYLIVWQDGWSGVDATADIKGVRLMAGTLEPLDKEPIAICKAPEAQDSPSVAYCPSTGSGTYGVFLVAWQDFRNGKDLDIRAALVDAKTGQVRGGEIELAVKPGNQALPAVAADGKTFLVAWQEVRGRDTYAVVAARVSTDGKVLDATPITVAELGCAPAAGGSGGKFLVTWTPDGQSTSGALVDAASGKVTLTIAKKPGGLNSRCPNATAIASDGAGNFMTVMARESYPNPWGWPGPGAVLCSRVNANGSAPEADLDYAWYMNNICSRKVPNVVDTATWGKGDTWQAGAPGGFKGTADGLWPNGFPGVAYDGKGSYLFVWVKGKITPDRLNLTNFDVWLRGMDAKTLAVTVPDRKAAADESVNEMRPVLVAGPAGELLLVYERIKPGEKRRIAVRKIGL